MSCALDCAHVSRRHVAASRSLLRGVSDNPGDSDTPRIRTRASALKVRPGRPAREQAGASKSSREGALPGDGRIGRVIAVDLESRRQVALFRHRIRSGRGLLEWVCHGY
jgi:hypothetical protein